MVGEMLEKFERCREFFEPRGVKIYNAGIGGKLEAFERKNFDDLLTIPKEQKDELFLQTIHQVNANVSLSDFVEYKGVKEHHFFLPMEDGVKLIREFITTHIPFGPYDGKYYFLKRQ